jgi:hypothetical protein
VSRPVRIVPTAPRRARPPVGETHRTQVG